MVGTARCAVRSANNYRTTCPIGLIPTRQFHYDLLSDARREAAHEVRNFSTVAGIDRIQTPKGLLVHASGTADARPCAFHRFLPRKGQKYEYGNQQVEGMDGKVSKS